MRLATWAAGVVAVAGLAGGALAADQTILGKSLSVKNPSTPDRRKVVVVGKEPGSPNTLVGNPTVNGATLTVVANGGTPTSQTFLVPQGISATGKPFWSAIGTTGYKYKDSKGEQGPVKTILLKRAPSGNFTVKAVVQGKLDGGTTIVPPNPGTDGCVVVAIGLGDAYHLRFGNDSIVKNSGTKLFKAKKPQSEGLCGGVTTTTTTSTSTSTTTTTLYGSPSRAFLETVLGLLD
jgi:hypothetical protein